MLLSVGFVDLGAVGRGSMAATADASQFSPKASQPEDELLAFVDLFNGQHPLQLLQTATLLCPDDCDSPPVTHSPVTHSPVTLSPVTLSPVTLSPVALSTEGEMSFTGSLTQSGMNPTPVVSQSESHAVQETPTFAQATSEGQRTVPTSPEVNPEALPAAEPLVAEQSPIVTETRLEVFSTAAPEIAAHESASTGAVEVHSERFAPLPGEKKVSTVSRRALEIARAPSVGSPVPLAQQEVLPVGERSTTSSVLRSTDLTSDDANADRESLQPTHGSTLDITSAVPAPPTQLPSRVSPVPGAIALRIAETIGSAVIGMESGEVVSVEADLHPAELGRLQIRLSKTSAGLHAVILAEDEAVQQIIAQHTSSIEQIVRTELAEQGGVQLQLGEHRGGQQFSSAQDGRSGHPQTPTQNPRHHHTSTVESHQRRSHADVDLLA